MFARTIHCLTLVAFSAHVVLGCCLHHHHSDASAMCAHHSGDGRGLETDNDHDHEHQHGAADHDCDAESGNDLPPPCDHSPQCEQGSCKFVGAKPKSAELADGGVFAAILLRGFSIDIRRSLAIDRIDRLLPNSNSSGQLCALQQSWQI